jgi:hypothetical protein
MTSLLVMVPTRGRRAQCERLLKSFQENTVRDTTKILFITDADDQETYDGMDWGEAEHGILEPRDCLTGKLNRTADAYMNQYDALMFLGDDHVIMTSGWDDVMLTELEHMGGTGMLYPDDKRRQDIPEIIMISSDIVKLMGQFAEATLHHYYIDNAWGDLGKRSGMLRWVPRVLVEHRHYSVAKDTEYDNTYKETEKTWGDTDLKAFQYYRASMLALQVSVLRRFFNPDIKWVTERVK